MGNYEYSNRILNSMLHRNVIVKNETTPEELWNQIKDSMRSNPNLNQDPTPIDDEYSSAIGPTYNSLTVTVWNMDDFRNKEIKISRVAGNIKFNIKNRRAYSTIASDFRREYSTSRNFIKALKTPKNVKAAQIATLDIETMEIEGLQTP